MDKNFIKNIIENHLKDKIKDNDYKFKYASKKLSGVSEGYIAKKENDNQYFMIKSALSKDYSIVGIKNNYSNETIVSNDSVNFVNEYIMSAVYRRILYNRSPLIELLNTSEYNKMKLRSKFLNNFQTLAEFTRSNQDFSIGNKTESLNKVKGAEKLFAAIIFCGESDFHSGNIGIIDEIDEFGNITKAFAKIDHGWSGSKFFSKPMMMIDSFENAYKKYGYESNIDLDSNSLIESFEEIVKIKDKEMKSIIGERIYKLKKSGFDIRNLRLPYWINNTDNHHKELNYLKIDNFEQLEKYYIANLSVQKHTIERFLENPRKIIFRDSIGESSNWRKFIKQNREKDISVINI